HLRIELLDQRLHLAAVLARLRFHFGAVPLGRRRKLRLALLAQAVQRGLLFTLQPRDVTSVLVGQSFQRRPLLLGLRGQLLLFTLLGRGQLRLVPLLCLLEGAHPAPLGVRELLLLVLARRHHCILEPGVPLGERGLVRLVQRRHLACVLVAQRGQRL